MHAFFSPEDVTLMTLALEEARRAGLAGEVPVGAVLWVPTSEGARVFSSSNTTERRQNALRHAEMNVLEEAMGALSSSRLTGARLYVTLEPCAMCAGALLHARVSEVIFACREPRTGAVRSHLHLLESLDYFKEVRVHEGLCEEAAAKLLSEFFENRRHQRESGD